MGAIAGLIRHGGRAIDQREFVGVHGNLSPYGQPRVWTGTSGSCSVMLCGYETGDDYRHPYSLAIGVEERFVAVGDAFIHHRDDLLRALGGRIDPTCSDVALLLHSYERWGDSFTEFMSGTFAAAIVDTVRGGVLLVRDHVGARPLTVFDRDGDVAFASNALALTGLPFVGHELDTDRVAEAVVVAYEGHRTFVKGVRWLPAGCSMWVGSGGSSQRRWWLSGPPPVVDLGSIEEHAALLRRDLQAAVMSVSRDAGPLGVLMSGGLDSPSIAATACLQLAPDVVHSYTSVPPRGWSGVTPRGWVPDETFAVEAMTQRYPNLKARFIDVRQRSLFALNESYWELGAGPIRNPLNSIWLAACFEEAYLDGVRVMLSGGWGNFAFSADGPRWLVELAKLGRFGEVKRESDAWSERVRRSRPTVLRQHLLSPLAPESLRQWRRRRQGRGYLEYWLAATSINPDRLDAMEIPTTLPRVIRPARLGFTRDIPHYIDGPASQADHKLAGEALFGIVERDPLSDRRLLESALSQPEWWRRHRGETRTICRAAMSDLLPPEVIERNTHGLQLPDWFDRMSDARREIDDELEAMRDHPTTRDVIDVPMLTELVRTWPQRDALSDVRTSNAYQLALSRAMHLSRYVRWFEDRSRRVASGGPAVVVKRPWTE